jgi:hypothetical protein
MQLLKVAVIVMGVMIVVGIGILGYTIVSRSSKLVTNDSAAPAVAEPAPALPGTEAAAPAGFASSALGLPAGSRIQSMSVEGRRLILVVGVPDAGERVIVVDLESGARLGAIHLEAAP